MPGDVEYKGWVIEAQSYESDGRRWRPKALVSAVEGGTLRMYPVSAPLATMFDTERESSVASSPHEATPSSSVSCNAPTLGNIDVPVVSIDRELAETTEVKWPPPESRYDASDGLSHWSAGRPSSSVQTSNLSAEFVISGVNGLVDAGVVWPWFSPLRHQRGDDRPAPFPS